ncbi:hypothetical protein GCM10018793_52270 [Streptomyces sulfonofaciens]|uniref:Uncharacterized protein n=1 Tax=Streptomyces sulfonofaciens TaxID=68272 RepID=A0A919GJK9_9ACTN|nr:DUF3574 domain-containing protein [Streptomyces sulfonofaciens]GHH85200.1 hypothetical protein GCM10018793_52270 [Streptomyces sulfonofaciens]
MRFRHPRTRLAIAGAAFAVLTVAVPATYAVLDDPPPALAQRSPARAAVPFAPVQTYGGVGLLLGSGRPHGGPPGIDRRFAPFADRWAASGCARDLTVRHDHGRWRHRPGGIDRRHYELILLHPVPSARSRAALVEDIRRVWERRYGQDAEAGRDRPTPADLR